MLRVMARHRLGDLKLDIDFSSDGGVTALFGPSGAGKTSIIRIIAGLLRPQEGFIEIGGEVYLDTKRRRFTPVHRRRLGYVFQEPRLFPHLSVRQNLLYSQWTSRKPIPSADLGRIAALLGIEHLLHRRPDGLSGGEKQRVAIGRALLAAPRLLLMDEPLAALDEARKAEILPYLDSICAEWDLPIIYVSHSVTETARLAKKVVLLRNGKVERQGPAAQILSSTEAWPSRRDAGVLLEGIARSIDTAQGLAEVAFQGLVLHVPAEKLAPGQRTRLYIAARDVMVARVAPAEISALNVIEGRIHGFASADHGMTDVTIVCGGETILSRITSLSVARLSLETGMRVFAIIKTVALET